MIADEIKAVVDMVTDARKAVGDKKEADKIRALCAKIDVSGGTPREAADIDGSLVMFAAFAEKLGLVVGRDDAVMFQGEDGGLVTRVDKEVASAYRILKIECKRRNIPLPGDDEYELNDSIAPKF